MEITDEMLETIYKRAYAYYEAEYGHQPDEIYFDEDGEFRGRHEYYIGCGDYASEDHLITTYNLTEDLEEVYKQAREMERIREEERRKRIKKEQEQKEKEAKEIRRREYLKLKKEFGDEDA